MKQIKTAVLIFLTIFVINKSGISQEVTWGDLNEAKSKNYYPSIIGEDETGIYIFSILKSDIFIEKYSKNNKAKLFEKFVEQPKVGKSKVLLEQVVYANGKFIILASYFDADGNNYKLYGYTIDGNTGEENAKVDLLSIPVEKRGRKGNFTVITSNDRSKILINHYAYYKEEKAYRDKYILMDDNLNILLEKEEKVYKEDVDYRVFNYIVDNDGSFYFLKSYSLSEKYILSYDATKNFEKWEEKINLDDLQKDDLITDLRFTIDRKNNLVVSGYYENKNKLMGCFYMKIDNFSKEVVTSKLNRFDEAFKDQFLTKRQAKKDKEAKIRNVFDNIEIIQKEEGGILLIGEFYQHIYYYNSNGGYRGESVENGDLIVLNMNEDGNLTWANRVPKNQYYYIDVSMYPLVIGSFGLKLFVIPARIPEYFSYLAGINDNNLYVMFNDNPENVIKSEQEKTKALKKIDKGVAMLYTMNIATGEKKKEIFMAIKNTDVYLKPIVSYQNVPGSNMIIYAMNKKKYRFGELKF